MNTEFGDITRQARICIDVLRKFCTDNKPRADADRQSQLAEVIAYLEGADNVMQRAQSVFDRGADTF
jgi:hypothetical protein